MFISLMLPSVRPRRRGLLAWVAASYALGLMTWQVLRFTPVGGWWAVVLLDIFGWVLFGPLLVLVPSAVLGRARRALVWLAVPLLLFAWEYGAVFLPRPGSADTAAPRLRVMTANLVWTNDNVQSLVAALAREQPDIVALQELGDGMGAALGSRLREVYPHRALYPSAEPGGLGILSRHPVVNRIAPESRIDGCACHEVTIAMGDAPVRVLNAHPEPPAVALYFVRGVPVPTGYDDRGRAPVLDALGGRIRAGGGPLVLLGDLNAGDRQPFYRELRRSLGDAYRTAGWGFGFTFPHGDVDGWPVPPLVRIDFVLHDSAWVAQAAWTGRLPESNHRYVVADLVLRSPN